MRPTHAFSLCFLLVTLSSERCRLRSTLAADAVSRASFAHFHAESAAEAATATAETQFQSRFLLSPRLIRSFLCFALLSCMSLPLPLCSDDVDDGCDGDADDDVAGERRILRDF